jgi:hypothetical protein
VALGHQTKSDTLRLNVSGLEELGDDGVAWAWSVGSALLEGTRKHFELDDDDLDVIVLTKKDLDGTNRALEILWVDKVWGAPESSVHSSASSARWRRPRYVICKGTIAPLPVIDASEAIETSASTAF